MPQITSNDPIDIELLEVNAKLKQTGFSLSGKLDSSVNNFATNVHLNREKNGFFDRGEIWALEKRANQSNYFIYVFVLNKKLFDVITMLEVMYEVKIEIKLCKQSF